MNKKGYLMYFLIAVAIGMVINCCSPKQKTEPPKREVEKIHPPLESKSVPMDAQVVWGSPPELVSDFNTEVYDYLPENEFLSTKQNPLSTFSIDVDTASYSNIRRFIKDRKLPPVDSVRIEEMINYFTYNYPEPQDDFPFSVKTELASCPWKPNHKLLLIGLKGKEIKDIERSPSNLVFLLDVSGSMDHPDKLPLLKRAMKLLINKLSEKDHVAISVYAGSSGVVLPSTTCSEKNKGLILDSLEKLRAGGSTHGSSGINLAYDVARENFIKDGINRVILATDGDFNVGITNQGELVRLIEEKAKDGIFLTVLGFGSGNLKDSTMEKLADKGNGNYGYIDNLSEARKMLVEEMGSTLVTIAKDVKIQIEFNPSEITAYRLVGYENRMLKAEDFHDDKKDAGEIGAGHTITALYELVPIGEPIDLPVVDPLKYQKKGKSTLFKNELLTVKLRYKLPDADDSELMTLTVKDTNKSYERASDDFRFAASVAEFGMLLRNSKFKGDTSYESIIDLALSAKGDDISGFRAEFINIVRDTKDLSMDTIDLD